VRRALALKPGATHVTTMANEPCSYNDRRQCTVAPIYKIIETNESYFLSCPTHINLILRRWVLSEPGASVTVRMNDG
jgi:hypothetical protein